MIEKGTPARLALEASDVLDGEPGEVARVRDDGRFDVDIYDGDAFVVCELDELEELHR